MELFPVILVRLCHPRIEKSNSREYVWSFFFFQEQVSGYHGVKNLFFIIFKLWCIVVYVKQMFPGWSLYITL